MKELKKFTPTTMIDTIKDKPIKEHIQEIHDYLRSLYQHMATADAEIQTGTTTSNVNITNITNSASVKPIAIASDVIIGNVVYFDGSVARKADRTSASKIPQAVIYTYKGNNQWYSMLGGFCPILVDNGVYTANTRLWLSDTAGVATGTLPAATEGTYDICLGWLEVATSGTAGIYSCYFRPEIVPRFAMEAV